MNLTAPYTDKKNYLFSWELLILMFSQPFPPPTPQPLVPLPKPDHHPKPLKKTCNKMQKWWGRGVAPTVVGCANDMAVWSLEGEGWHSAIWPDLHWEGWHYAVRSLIRGDAMRQCLEEDDSGTVLGSWCQGCEKS